jgi:prepilin-type processing-associated H-X9-DG protein
MPQAPAGYVDSAKTSGLAITSLVLGICGLFTCGVTALVGLILGIVAMTKIKNSAGALKGNGVAIAGICVSGLFLLMVPLPIAMLLPALAKAKQKAQAINCVNNAKQIGMGVIFYASANNDQLPPKASWCDSIQTTVGSPKAFICPATPGSRCGFAYNSNLDGKKTSEVNPRTVMIFESPAGWNGSGAAESLATPRHGTGGIIVGFADGSVQRVPPSQLSTLRWDP